MAQGETELRDLESGGVRRDVRMRFQDRKLLAQACILVLESVCLLKSLRCIERVSLQLDRGCMGFMLVKPAC